MGPRFPWNMNRRTLLANSVLLSATAQFAAAAETDMPDRGVMVTAVPPQMRQAEGTAKIADVELYYRDTGGSGIPVILLHPFTGSALVWAYQQPDLVKAGYRVIAYSRRGYFGSGNGPKDKQGTGADDLAGLMDFLGIGRANLMGTAGGAFVALDFALSFPERVRAMVLACSVLGINDPSFTDITHRITPQGFAAMPAEFREVSPSYRAANAEGTAEWVRLSKISGDSKVFQPNRTPATLAGLAQVKTPVLLIAGDSDLIAPPPMARMLRSHISNADLTVIPECGHSAYWEQPYLFNHAVISFLNAH
jgi:pimeloyl-ACP methyl ester carboxylesterase